jgi:hypothetical protein
LASLTYSSRPRKEAGNLCSILGIGCSPLFLQPLFFFRCYAPVEKGQRGKNDDIGVRNVKDEKETEGNEEVAHI